MKTPRSNNSNIHKKALLKAAVLVVFTPKIITKFKSEDTSI